MSYNTTERLPVIVTMEAAERRFNDTKPIRGSAGTDRPNGVRPLAHRRDTHLRIDRKVNTEGEVRYELFCYNSPVVTLRKHPTTTATIVTVKPHYISSYTCDFIRNIMWVGSRRPEFSIRNRQIVMQFPALTTNDSSPSTERRKYALGKDTEVSFLFNELTKEFELYSAEATYAWAPDKRKFAELCAPYKEFADYYAGFLSLLTQEVDDVGDDPFAAKRQVVVQYETLFNMFGLKEKDDSPMSRFAYDELDLSPWQGLMSKPTWIEYANVLKHRTQEAREKHQYYALTVWDRAVANFLTLVRSDQDEATKTDNFYKAALVLFCSYFMRNSSGLHVSRTKPEPKRLARTTADGLLRELFLQVFAEDVMERKEYPVGKLPSTNYGRYLFVGRREKGTNA